MSLLRRASWLTCVALAGALAACGGAGPVAAPLAGETATLPEPTTTTTEAPTTTTEAPTTTASTAAPTTTAARSRPPRTTVAPTEAKAAQPGPRRRAAGPAPSNSLEVYRGLGTWVDVYDWSHYKGATPTVGPADVDRMAEVGVQTLYLQTSKLDTPEPISEPELLMPIIERAHQRGIEVVAWYLPGLDDPAEDLRRLVASASLPVDGIAVDIESRKVDDVALRNSRLVELSAALREALPGRVIGAIVLPPVVLEVINQKYWPDFPYREIAPFYDVWMTMGYWTNRSSSSRYRDAYTYTEENVRRLRSNLGQPGAPVHAIGGIGDRTTAADIDGFRRAAADVSAIGASVYDWHTTGAEQWSSLRHFRS